MVGNTPLSGGRGLFSGKNSIRAGGGAGASSSEVGGGDRSAGPDQPARAGPARLSFPGRPLSGNGAHAPGGGGGNQGRQSWPARLRRDRRGAGAGPLGSLSGPSIP